MLAPGDQLGQYRVLSPLGAGGMGEVYLAEDTRLGRKVALKILPQATAADERARRRLIREAQAAATLDHANICTVYDVGEDDGQGFIAMQYVEGETLADRLRRGRLDEPAAVAIATQVAAALAEAHRHGITHRDVKPQNVMVTPGGQVKVLDFGLAHVARPFEHEAHTATVLTQEGTVAGTIPYMSPEQVRGEPLDARTDVFSFGCVLHELLAGANPFLRPHAAETMAAVLLRDPPPLPATTHPELQRIVRRCLEKDRERRYESAREVLAALEGVAREIADGVPRPATGSIPRRRFPRAAAVAALLAGAALLVAGALYVRASARRPLSPGDFVQLTALPDSAAAPALSPDGRMVAFIRGSWFLGTGQVYVKLLAGGDPVQLTNDPRPKYGPAFSPDGARVAYTVIDKPGTPAMSWDTWTVPVLGGSSARLLPNAAGLTWIDEGHVLFSAIESGSGLHMGVVTAGEDRQGERRIYFPAESRAMAHFSSLSPDRRWVLVVEMDRTGTFQPCRVVPFDGSTAGQRAGPDGQCTAAGWSPDGAWMYFTASVAGASHLWRQRFPGGTPEQLTAGPATEERGVAIAPDGRSLVTAVGQEQGSLWVHDASGDRLIPLDGSVSSPRLSRDGTRVFCLVRRAGEPSARGVTQVDLASGKTARVLTDHAIVDFDVSRDEQDAAFTAIDEGGRRHVWHASLDRRSPPRRVASDADRARFTRDGELVVRSLTGTANGLVRIGTDGRGATRIFNGQVLELGSVSPDGEWAIVATPLPEDPSAGQTIAVPVHGGSARRVCVGQCPVNWAPDGSAVYLREDDGSGNSRMVRYALRGGEMLPSRTPGEASAAASQVHAVAGDVAWDWDAVTVGPDPSMYVFTKTEQRGNLFRVALR